jgi:predicted permease
VIGAAVGLIALTRAGTAGLFDSLRSARSTSSRRWRRAQNGLVALQVAIALTLLVAAGLLGRSFWNLRNAKIGFVPENAISFQVSLPWDTYRSYGEHAAFHAKVIDRLAAIPGVSSAGLALRVPLASRGVPTLEPLEVADENGRATFAATGNTASADYFRTMGIPLRVGRTFRSGDLRGTPAAIVSERVAMSLFGTTDVLGRHVRRQTDVGRRAREFTIVGVVGDVHWERIEDGYAPMIYFPLLRDGDGFPADSNPAPYQPRDVQYVVRGSPLPDAATIQGVLTQLDHRIPAASVRTLTGVVDDATARVRLTLLLIAIAGGAALLLGVIGVYSVVSYAASGRVREFSIRLALGAAPTRVGGMVFGDGLRIIALGTGAGLLAALGATRFLRALLYEVKPTSVVEFGLATALLAIVTLVASFLPARRAAQTHPAMVLRGE